MTAFPAMSADVHRRPPNPDDSKDVWLKWVNNVPTYRRFGLRCVDFDPGCAEFLLADNPFPLAADGKVPPAVLMAAADMIAGAIAIRAAPAGHAAVTGSLFVQVHGNIHYPVHLVASLLHGTESFQTVNVEVYGGRSESALTMPLTMIMSASAAVH